jgi:glucose uptake protein
MYLPTTYIAALLLAILSMFCWGSWANTQKLTKKWRFEFFYFDFAIGVLVLAVLVAFTFGSLNGNELSTMDTFSLTGYSKIAEGCAAGVVFNLANMLLVAAIAVAGMSVAFPIAIGLAMVIGVVWSYALNPQGNPTLLFSGAAVVIAAVIVNAIAYKIHARAKAPPPEPVAAVKKGARKVTAVKDAPKRPGATKGIAISIASGILMGCFYPLLEHAKSGGDGLEAYAAALVFAIGIFVSTFLFDFFFMLLPVAGEPADMLGYFRGTKRQHFLGFLGGVIWMIGGAANFIAASAPVHVQVGPAVSYALGQGAALISALWGLLLWKEFAGASSRVRTLIGIMLLLFLGGLILIAVAPLYVRA